MWATGGGKKNQGDDPAPSASQATTGEKGGKPRGKLEKKGVKNTRNQKGGTGVATKSTPISGPQKTREPFGKNRDKAKRAFQKW